MNVTGMDEEGAEGETIVAIAEGRHNRTVESQNVRLAFGGLIFAILAILTPMIYEELGLIAAGTTALAVVIVSSFLLIWRNNARRAIPDKQKGDFPKSPGVGR